MTNKIMMAVLMGALVSATSAFAQNRSAGRRVVQQVVKKTPNGASRTTVVKTYKRTASSARPACGANCR